MKYEFDNLFIGFIDVVFCLLGLFLIVTLIRSSVQTIAGIPLMDGTAEVYITIMFVFSFVFAIRNYIKSEKKEKN